MLALMASAIFSFTSKTEATGPISITDCTGLQNMNQDLTADYILNGPNNVIDCTATSTWNSDGNGGFYGFAPVGDNSTPFTGTLDGNGNTITGLYINRPLTNSIGLFGYVNNATIQDLTLSGGSITGNFQVAALIGNTNGGSLTVSNVTSNINVSGNGVYVGGLIGNFYTGTPSSITGNSVQATVSNSGANGGGSGNIGGLAGYVGNYGSANVTISGNSFIGTLTKTGTVSNNEAGAGGLIGELDSYYGGTTSVTHNFTQGTISNTTANSNPTYSGTAGLIGLLDVENNPSNVSISSNYSSAAVAGTYYSGGFIGELYTCSFGAGPGMLISISDDYASGAVAGTDDVGGFIGGVFQDDCGVPSSALTISNTYASGAVTGTNFVGGLIGDLLISNPAFATTNLSNSFSTGAVSGSTDAGGLIGRNSASNTFSHNYYDSNRSTQSKCVGSDSGESDPAFCAPVNIGDADPNYFYNSANFPFDQWDFPTTWNSKGYPVLTFFSPVTVPDAPTALSATAGDAQAALSWTAPVNDGGSPLTDYLIEYDLTSDNFASPLTFSHSPSTTTSATITSLTNGSSYDFKVSAINSIGTSSPSSTASATPASSSSSSSTHTGGTHHPSDSIFNYPPYTTAPTLPAPLTPTTSPSLSPAPALPHTLTLHSPYTEEVKTLQSLLTTLHLYTDSLDGLFGPHTKTAVIAFQTLHHLIPDGIVGPKTWGALKALNL